VLTAGKKLQRNESDNERREMQADLHEAAGMGVPAEHVLS
jgi:hypothetical protein